METLEKLLKLDKPCLCVWYHEVPLAQVRDISEILGSPPNQVNTYQAYLHFSWKTELAGSDAEVNVRVNL